MSDSSPTENEGATINRRRVLKSAAAASAVTGMSGIASADASAGFSKAEIDGVRDQYRSLDAVSAVLGSETEVLESLSEAGYIDEASVDALGIESLGEPDSESDAHVAIDHDVVDGDVVAEIKVAREYDDGRLIVSARPATDDSFAVFDSDDEDGIEQITVDPCYGNCDDNEECKSRCAPCGSETCLGCDGSDAREPEGYCDCVENCDDGWF